MFPFQSLKCFRSLNILYTISYFYLQIIFDITFFLLPSILADHYLLFSFFSDFLSTVYNLHQFYFFIFFVFDVSNSLSVFSTLFFLSFPLFLSIIYNLHQFYNFSFSILPSPCLYASMTSILTTFVFTVLHRRFSVIPAPLFIPAFLRRITLITKSFPRASNTHGN